MPAGQLQWLRSDCTRNRKPWEEKCNFKRNCGGCYGCLEACTCAEEFKHISVAAAFSEAGFLLKSAQDSGHKVGVSPAATITASDLRLAGARLGRVGVQWLLAEWLSKLSHIYGRLLRPTPVAQKILSHIDGRPNCGPTTWLSKSSARFMAGQIADTLHRRWHFEGRGDHRTVRRS